MKKLLFRSLVIALLIGSCTGFVDFVASVHVSARYDPPITEDEGRKLRDLPIAKAEEVLSARKKPFTRMQWLEDSIRYSYFWKAVARHSVIPTVGIFVACVFLVRLEKQDGNSSLRDQDTK